MSATFLRKRVALAACCLAAAFAAAAWAGSTPPAISLPPADPGTDGAESIQVPAIEFVPALPGEHAPLPVRIAPAIDPRDRGSEFTDGAFDRPLTALNSLEQAKLDLARAAVAAGYASGTLPMQLPEDPGPALTEEEANAIKLAQIGRPAPGGTAPDAPGALGADVPPVQVNGPAGLNELERAKLEGRALPSRESAGAGDAGSTVAPASSAAPGSIAAPAAAPAPAAPASESPATPAAAASSGGTATTDSPKEVK
jgi:DNA polymerase-3 subunit gamma/tau